ncbi:MAG: flavin reductase [Nitriliruptorales bacterium]|nr:flavin reductase [Nitriliruptorales bacterium]
MVPPVDTAEFRRIAGRFATGVTVVTTGVEGTIHGMTANAFASLSLDPLLVLVCVDLDAGLHELLPHSRTFAVNVLAEGQEDLSRWFSSKRRPEGYSQFDGVVWVPSPVTGSPLLDGALAYLDCEVADILKGGDHSIFLGAVRDLGELGGKAPLLWYESGYHRLPED